MALPGTPQEHPPELPEAGGPGREKPEVTPQSKATSCWLSRGPGRKQPHQRSPCSNWVCLLCSPGRAFLVALTLWSASGSAGLLLPSDMKPLILRDIESGFFHPQVFRFPLNPQAGGWTRATVGWDGAHGRRSVHAFRNVCKVPCPCLQLASCFCFLISREIEE